MCGLICAGCTVVRVEGGRARHYAGTLRIEPAANAALVSVATRSWGVVADGRSMLIGFGRSQTVVMPPNSRCAMIVIVEPGATLPMPPWREFLNRYPNICLQGGK